MTECVSTGVEGVGSGSSDDGSYQLQELDSHCEAMNLSLLSFNIVTAVVFIRKGFENSIRTLATKYWYRWIVSKC